MSKALLIQNIQPICSLIRTLDLTDTSGARKALNTHFPLESLEHIRTLCISGLNEGWLCTREAPNLKYGRVQKTSDALPIGVDSVYMPAQDTPCEGPGHEHPNGEVDLCFALKGEALFDNNKEGWTVYPPKSWHIPTVTKGDMVILYFLPNGAIRFGPPTSPG